MNIAMVLFSVFLVFGDEPDDVVNADPVADQIAQDVNEQLAARMGDDIRVVMNISRDVKKAKIYKNGKVFKTYDISGAKNKPTTVKGVRYCAFTPTGNNLKPLELLPKRVTTEHEENVTLYNFVTLDIPRGIGAHQGDVSGYSSGCLRQTKEGAKALFDIVKENSKLVPGTKKIASTNVKFDIIDNTPGRYTAECGCLRNHMGDTNSPRSKRACALAETEPKAKVAEEKPAKKAVKPTKKQATAKTKKQPAVKPVEKKKTIEQIIKEGGGGLY